MNARKAPGETADLAATGVVLGAATVWTSPVPFAEAAIGQTIPSTHPAPSHLVLTARLNLYVASLTGGPAEPPCSLSELQRLSSARLAVGDGLQERLVNGYPRFT
jgi:hypothetical protein